jgi:hypothetical protein
MSLDLLHSSIMNPSVLFFLGGKCSSMPIEEVLVFSWEA